MTTQDEDEVEGTWLRAVHSLILPLALKGPARSKAFQLMSGNITVVVLGFTMGLVAGMNENIFITENMLKALGLPALLLILHSAIALLGIKFSTDVNIL